MKKYLVFPLIAIISLLIPSCILGGLASGVYGNGEVVEEVRELDGFTGIIVSSGIDVYLTQDDVFSVKVVADENLMEIIKTEVNGRMLNVGVDKRRIRRAESKKVYVSLPELDKLRISSAGDCEGETSFSCTELDIEISSAGDLKLDVEADEIHVNISSSGDARLSGSVNELRATLSSAGDLNAYDLKAKRVDVNVSSAGDAKVYASEELNMVSSSAGNIHYKGKARILQSNKSSAGDIVDKN